MQRSFRGRRREQSKGQRPPGGEARLGNGPVDRFRAERAEPQGAARRAAGRGICGAIQPYAEVFLSRYAKGLDLIRG